MINEVFDQILLPRSKIVNDKNSLNESHRLLINNLKIVKSDDFSLHQKFRRFRRTNGFIDLNHFVTPHTILKNVNRIFREKMIVVAFHIPFRSIVHNSTSKSAANSFPLDVEGKRLKTTSNLMVATLQFILIETTQGK